jgi:hypothetical protein
VAEYVRVGGDTWACSHEGCVNPAVGIDLQWVAHEGKFTLTHGAVCDEHRLTEEVPPYFMPATETGGGRWFVPFDSPTIV